MRLVRVSRWIVASGLVVACSSHDQPPVTKRSHSPTPPPPAVPPPVPPTPAATRDEALALALAHAQAAHPGASFRLLEETQGGGLHGPWVFQLSPPAPPLLVHYRTADVIEIAPHANGLRAAVHAWEIATYGHPQR